MYIRSVLFGLLFTIPVSGILAQTDTSKKQEGSDLMDLLEQDKKMMTQPKQYTSAVFKTTRIINGHSIENTGKGILDFKIGHRFGPVNSGIKDFFGFDGATTMLGFDYGITDWLTVGISRSSYEKEYEGYVKARILRQTDNTNMPLSVSYVGAISVNSVEPPELPAGQTWYFSNRLYYVNQILVARKFNQWLSLQLMPTHVHFNLVDKNTDPNNILAMGIGGRVKLSQRVTFNAEYYYQFEGTKFDYSVNSLSLGFDIETGGHVFQLHFTNSVGMTERTFVAQTRDKWGDGAIHLGFNIARVFTIVRPKEFQNSRNKIY